MEKEKRRAREFKPRILEMVNEGIILEWGR
jgi:hypothetical protein